MMSKLRLNIQTLKKAVALLLVFSFSGCAVIGANSLFEEDAQFKRKISPTKYKSATPVDVATEFNALVAEGAYQLPIVSRRNLSSVGQSQAPQPIIIGSYCQMKPTSVQSCGDAVEDGGVQNTESKVTSATIIRGVSNVRTRPGAKVKTTPIEKTDAYKVRPGDTLMKISFEHYGDIYKWRQILQDNKNLISNYRSLVPGTVLKVRGEEFVVVEKNGRPYLIRKNETLLKISKNLYGSKQYWKTLWDNNRQMIKDPNKIYAGFTLYYLDLNQQVRPVLPEKLQASKVQPSIQPPVVQPVSQAQPSTGSAVPTLESTTQSDRVPAQNR
jgi:hypothetical protein